MRRVTAEATGSFAIGLAGTAAIALGAPNALAGLAAGGAAAAVTLALSSLSGAHFHPAVTLTAALGGRIAWRDVPSYLGAQLAGGSLAGLVTTSLARGRSSFADAAERFAPGFGVRSPGGHGLDAALLFEVVSSGLLALVVVAALDPRDRGGVSADIARSVRPAQVVQAVCAGLLFAVLTVLGASIERYSLGPGAALAGAVTAGGVALSQVWLFVVGPVVGALAAAGICRLLAVPPSVRGESTISARGTARPARAFRLEEQPPDEEDAPSTLRSPRWIDLPAPARSIDGDRLDA